MDKAARVSSATATQGYTDSRAVKQQRQQRDQYCGNRGSNQVELADHDLAHEQRDILDAQVQRPYLGAHQPLRQPFDDEGQAEGGHEQGDLRAVDQRPQYQAFDQQRADDHHYQGQGQRQHEGHALLVQADKGQRSKQQHRALGEVEHATGLVDQHKTDRYQRVHGAGEQATDQGFQEEIHQCTVPR